MCLCLLGAICSRKSASCYVQNSNTQNQLEVGFGTVFGAPVHCNLGTFTGPRAEIFHVGAHSSAHDLHSGSRLLMPTLSGFSFCFILLYVSCCLSHLHLFPLCLLDVSSLPLCFAHQLPVVSLSVFVIPHPCCDDIG